MHMQIDEAGCNHKARRIQPLKISPEASRLGDLSDAAVPHQQVLQCIQIMGGIDHAAAADQQWLGLNFHDCTSSARAKIAMRTVTPLATCSRIRERPLSAISPVISIPRTMGPGCITSASREASFSRSVLSWKSRM